MLTAALMLGLGVSALAGCNPSEGPSNPGPGSDSQPTEPSVSTPSVVVKSVTITDDEGEEPTTDVFDNCDIQLKANVSVENSSDKADTKVTWSVDKPEVASVTSTGLVTIEQIATDTETVTVTATSKVDNTKSASVTLNIKHSLINILNSKPVSLDTENYYEDGVIEQGDNTVDTGLIYADVYGTKWYVETELRVMSLDPTDAYPKFGIMTGTDQYATWQDGKHPFGFYYVDLAQASTNNWTGVNFVVNNDSMTDWAWGSQLGGAQLGEKIELTKKFKLGLMRDGADYYYFYGSDSNNYETFKCYRHVKWEGIAADEPSYAWVGGFRTAVKAGGFKALVGDAADAMFADLETFDVKKADTVLFVNESEAIEIVAPASNYRLSDFAFTSANPDVATVDANGVITAGANPGTTSITVNYKGKLEKTVSVTVTDDPKFSVILDGKMDDALWTSDVKANNIKFSAGNLADITLYASRNSRGIYLFLDYVAKQDFTSTGGWWTDDNIEFKFTGLNGHFLNAREVEINSGDKAQYWISQEGNGSSNFSAHYVSPTHANEDGTYSIVFEFFAAYDYMGADPADKIGFSFGMNPGGKQWCPGPNMGSTDFSAINKITEEGIVRYYDESSCDGNHIYGDWRTVSNATCAADGLRERFCKLCNHHDTEVLPKGEHSFTGTITANSEGSCMGKQACAAECGATKDVVMESFTTHEAWDADAKVCTKCHNKLEHMVNIERYDAGGPYDGSLVVAEKLVGEYDVEVVLTGIHSQTGGWWKGVLPCVRDADVENGSCFVTRFDWWGWVDQNGSASNLNNKPGNGNPDTGDIIREVDWITNPGENWDEVWANGRPTLRMHMKKTATDIINEWTLTVTEGRLAGTSYTSFCKLSNPKLDTSITLTIGAEFSRFTATKIIYHTANFAA